MFFMNFSLKGGSIDTFAIIFLPFVQSNFLIA